MIGATAEQTLGWLEEEPADPYSATTLRYLEAHPGHLTPDRLWTPRWWQLTTPSGLPALGLVAMQVASGGHPRRLEQVWPFLHDPHVALSMDGPVPLAGLLWLVCAKEAALSPWAHTLATHLAHHGVSKDQAWTSAWQASNTLRTQNAVDLPWKEVADTWAEDRDFHVSRPSPAVAADLVLSMAQANLRELSMERLWETYAKKEEAPLLPWMAAHTTRMEEAGHWLAQMVYRKRKVWPAIDLAISRLLARGTPLTLPPRGDTLLPRSASTQIAAVRAQDAATIDRPHRSRGRRVRS